MPARIYKAPITHLLISLIQREQRHFISPKPFFSLEKKGAVAQREIIIKKKGKPTMTIHHNRLLWTLLYFILFCLAFFILFFILFYDNDDGDLNNIYYRYDSIIEPISNVYTREPVILPSLLLSVCLSFSLILYTYDLYTDEYLLFLSLCVIVELIVGDDDPVERLLFCRDERTGRTVGGSGGGSDQDGVR